MSVPSIWIETGPYDRSYLTVHRTSLIPKLLFPRIPCLRAWQVSRLFRPMNSVEYPWHEVFFYLVRSSWHIKALVTPIDHTDLALAQPPGPIRARCVLNEALHLASRRSILTSAVLLASHQVSTDETIEQMSSTSQMTPISPGTNQGNLAKTAKRENGSYVSRSNTRPNR